MGMGLCPGSQLYTVHRVHGGIKSINTKTNDRSSFIPDGNVCVDRLSQFRDSEVVEYIRLFEHSIGLTLQNKLHGSISPLWLLEPGPIRGASWTC
jgi:hypothetical protein